MSRKMSIYNQFEGTIWILRKLICLISVVLSILHIEFNILILKIRQYFQLYMFIQKTLFLFLNFT